VINISAIAKRRRGEEAKARRNREEGPAGDFLRDSFAALRVFAVAVLRLLPGLDFLHTVA
jgi:hypothetical protein